jgi:lipoate-protein ligase A
MLSVLATTSRVLNDSMLAGARSGVVNLREVLGRVPAIAALRGAFIDAFGAEFGAQLDEADLNPVERRRFEAALAEMDTEEWVGYPTASAKAA